MDQLSFADAEHRSKRKRTRREVFLNKMIRTIPCDRMEAIIEPYYSKAGNGRRAHPLSTMLRIHCL